MTQLQRIVYIMSNDNLITCDHCGRSYIPLGVDQCPFCRGDEALNNELREIERLENEGENMRKFTRELTDKEQERLTKVSKWAREVVYPTIKNDEETGILLDLFTGKRITATKQRKIKRVA